MNGDVADTDPAAKHYLPQHDLHQTYVSNEIFIDERSHLTDEYRTRARPVPFAAENAMANLAVQVNLCRRFKLIDGHPSRLKR